MKLACGLYNVQLDSNWDQLCKITPLHNVNRPAMIIYLASFFIENRTSNLP